MPALPILGELRDCVAQSGRPLLAPGAGGDDLDGRHRGPGGGRLLSQLIYNSQ